MTEMLILAVYLPENDHPVVGGFVLVEPHSRQYRIVFRRDWSLICGEEDAEVLSGMEETLESIAAGAWNQDEFLTDLENRLSNTIRCVDRLSVPVSAPFEEQCATLARGLLGVELERGR